MSGNSFPAPSVVIPCFNEAGAVAATLKEVARVVPGAEIIVVDDGSTDGTRQILEDLLTGGGLPKVTVIRHERNRGYGAAVKAGIRRTRREVVVITDADGTYPADRIPDLLREMADADMVVGARTGASVSVPAARRLPKSLLRSFASWLVGQPIPDVNSGLRAFRRDVALRYLNVLPDGFSLTTTLTIALLRGRYEVRFLAIDYASRVGSSKIRPFSDTLKFFQLSLRTGMYFAPLRVFGPAVAALGAGFLASLAYDTLKLDNLTDKTVLLLILTVTMGSFTLLADMIDKRSG